MAKGVEKTSVCETDVVCYCDSSDVSVKETRLTVISSSMTVCFHVCVVPEIVWDVGMSVERDWLSVPVVVVVGALEVVCVSGDLCSSVVDSALSSSLLGIVVDVLPGCPAVTSVENCWTVSSLETVGSHVMTCCEYEGAACVAAISVALSDDV